MLATDPQGVDRLTLADGLELVSSQRGVSRRKRRHIAAARSLVFTGITTLAVSLSLWAAVIPGPVLEHSWRMTKELQEFPGVHLTLAICDGDLSNITFGDRRLVLKELEGRTNHRIAFRPKGPLVAQMDLARLDYFDFEEYASESWFGPVDEWYPALSFGLFQVWPISFDVAVEGSSACSRGNERLAAAIQHLVEEAGERSPSGMNSAGGISHYGSLLLRMNAADPSDPLRAAVWSQKTTSFGPAYEESEMLFANRCLMLALVAVSAAVTFAMLSRVVYSEWCEAVDDWIVTFDWLWEAGLRPKAAQVAGGGVAAEIPMVRGASRAQLLSLHFLFDNVVGNSQFNSESWAWGAASAASAALCTNVLLAVPVFTAVFVDDLRVLLAFLAIAHGVVSSAYAVCYYCSVKHGRLRFCIWCANIGVEGILFAWTHLRMISTTMFMITRLVVEEKKAGLVLIPAVSILVFCAVMYHNLQSLRKKALSDAKGKGMRGTINQVLQETQVNTCSIVVFVSLSGVFLLLLWLLVMMLFVMSETSSDTLHWNHTEVLGTISVPFAAFMAAVSKQQSAQSALKKFQALTEEAA